MPVINVGVGDVYITELTSDISKLDSTTDTTIEAEANKIPHTSGGVTFNYTLSKNKIEDDKGVTVDEAKESEELKIKIGILEDMAAMYEWLAETAVIDDTDSKETKIKIGGDVASGKKFVFRYVHTRKNGKKVRYTAILLPASGFSEPYQKGAAKIVDCEMTGVIEAVNDNTLLVKRIEK